MSLNELDIRDEYRSLLHNIAEEFLIPALQKATAYDRAVGFFSSTVLASIAYGIEGLARNGGKIRLIASPKLTEEDIEAIKKGYRDREEVITASLSVWEEVTFLTGKASLIASFTCLSQFGHFKPSTFAVILNIIVSFSLLIRLVNANI